MINTVRGPIAPEALGRTLMHEHIFVLSTEILQNYPKLWDEQVRVAEAIDRLRELKHNGIDTIVDLTVIGHGRFIPRIERICAEVDLNVVVAAGIYTYDSVPTYFHLRGPGTMGGGPERMVEMFVEDIQDGIGDTSVRAGILKYATDEPGFTIGVERVIHAVAAAHVETGVPISTHTVAALRQGLQQQDLLEADGVDLRRVVIGHCGDTTDTGYLKEVMARGSYIGMDRFGGDVMLPFEARVDTVAKLCDEGFAGQMVLSHDAMCFSDWLPSEFLPTVPNWHFLHITRDVVPALRERGVTEHHLEQMLVDNPRRVLDSHDDVG